MLVLLYDTHTTKILWTEDKCGFCLRPYSHFLHLLEKLGKSSIWIAEIIYSFDTYELSNVFRIFFCIEFKNNMLSTVFGENLLCFSETILPARANDR